MNELSVFLVENYFNLKKQSNNNYFKRKNPYLKNIKNDSNTYKMSAAMTPEGIVTQQSPGESFDGLDEKLKNVHPVHRENIKGKYRLGEKIDSIYQKFINSREGKEFVNYLKKNGNGISKTGSIDDILVVNKGEGIVAATVPDAVRKNLIINQDYIDEYVTTASSATGLSYQQVIENVLVHELHHIYGQTRSERTGNEKDIEYNNDISLIKFYTGLAKKDVENSDVYLTKAKLFTARYDGKHRKTMDEMILKVQEDISKYYSRFDNAYSRAA